MAGANIETIHEPARQLELLRSLLGTDSAEQALLLPEFAEMLQDPVRRGQIVFLKQSLANGETSMMLAELHPGHAATLWPPCGAAFMQSRQELLAALLEQLQARGVFMAQAVFNLHDRAHRELFESQGFVCAAELVILSLEQAEFPQAPPEREWQWEAVPREDARWATLLSATYHESRDCPLVDGWRSLNDVLDSYQATGQYLPEGWRIARVGTVDVGCAIVAAHPAHRQWELIYFGVHPAARGLGWGTVILAQILFTARERNVSELVLTVDAANLPALRIYTEAGFQELDRRFVLVRRLQAASAQPPI